MDIFTGTKLLECFAYLPALILKREALKLFVYLIYIITLKAVAYFKIQRPGPKRIFPSFRSVLDLFTNWSLFSFKIFDTKDTAKKKHQIVPFYIILFKHSKFISQEFPLSWKTMELGTLDWIYSSLFETIMSGRIPDAKIRQKYAFMNMS